MQAHAKAPRNAPKLRSAEALLNSALRSPAQEFASPAAARPQRPQSSLGDSESVATSLSVSEDSYADTMVMRSTASLGPSRTLARAARKHGSGLQIRPESLLKANYGRPPPRLAELAVVEAQRQARNVLRNVSRRVLERIVPGVFDKKEVWPPKALSSSLVSRAPARWEPHAPRKYPVAEEETLKPSRQAYLTQAAPMPPPVRWFGPPAAPQKASPMLSSQSAPSLPAIEASRQPASSPGNENAGVEAYLKKVKEQNRRRRQESMQQLRSLARGAGGGPYTLGQVYVEVEAISRHVPTPDCRALEGSLGPDAWGGARGWLLTRNVSNITRRPQRENPCSHLADGTRDPDVLRNSVKKLRAPSEKVGSDQPNLPAGLDDQCDAGAPRGAPGAFGLAQQLPAARLPFDRAFGIVSEASGACGRIGLVAMPQLATMPEAAKMAAASMLGETTCVADLEAERWPGPPTQGRGRWPRLEAWAEEGLSRPDLEGRSPQAVRDLAWLALSPHLLTPGLQLLQPPGTVAESLAWLAQLDADPSGLLEELRAVTNIHRLGFYASSLTEYWLRHGPSWDVGDFVTGVPLTSRSASGKYVTAGQLKFVGSRPAELLHVESSLKFFIDAVPARALQDELASMSRFVGPFLHENFAWRLAEARRKLGSSSSEAVLKFIQARLGDAPVRSAYFLKGFVFRPLEDFRAGTAWRTPPEVNAGCCVGWYTSSLDDLSASLPAGARAAILPKLFWLGPAEAHGSPPAVPEACGLRGGQDSVPVEAWPVVREQIKRHFALHENALLVCVLLPLVGAEDVWAEESRGFFFPPTWDPKDLLTDGPRGKVTSREARAACAKRAGFADVRGRYSDSFANEERQRPPDLQEAMIRGTEGEDEQFFPPGTELAVDDLVAHVLEHAPASGGGPESCGRRTAYAKKQASTLGWAGTLDGHACRALANQAR
ncbi:unnamed protein product [Prorocentrum cordatum]|uniref:Uncharacterized protein n=1 Tax=Prorocentrum cordatum TaxID=2364126 RepID=A0ABN9V1S7_9DINO|nr:unnamed protein product [Polarella glacialis]